MQCHRSLCVSNAIEHCMIYSHSLYHHEMCVFVSNNCIVLGKNHHKDMFIFSQGYGSHGTIFRDICVKECQNTSESRKKNCIFCRLLIFVSYKGIVLVFNIIDDIRRSSLLSFLTLKIIYNKIHMMPDIQIYADLCLYFNIFLRYDTFK